MKGKKDKDIYLHTISMINLATDWIELHAVPEVRACSYESNESILVN